MEEKMKKKRKYERTNLKKTKFGGTVPVSVPVPVAFMSILRRSIWQWRRCASACDLNSETMRNREVYVFPVGFRHVFGRPVLCSMHKLFDRMKR